MSESVSSSLFALGGCEGSSNPPLSVAKPYFNSGPLTYYTRNGKFYYYTRADAPGHSNAPHVNSNRAHEDTVSEVCSFYTVRTTNSMMTENNIGAGRVLGLLYTRFVKKMDSVIDDLTIGVQTRYHRWQRRRTQRAAEKQRKKDGRKRRASF